MGKLFSPNLTMINSKFKSQKEYKNVSSVDYARNTFFCQEGVNKRLPEHKDVGLKNRLRALILERGMSEPIFFNKLGITRQYWYRLSWGIIDCPKYLKIRIAKLLNVDTLVVWGVEE